MVVARVVTAQRTGVRFPPAPRSGIRQCPSLSDKYLNPQYNNGFGYLDGPPDSKPYRGCCFPGCFPSSANRTLNSRKATAMARPRPKRSTLPDGSVVVAGKRANGAGSTYYVASRGVWRSTWVDPTTGRRRSVSSATRAEAEQRAAEAATRAATTTTRPLGADPDTTIGQVAEWWLDNVAAPEVRPPTLHAYRKDVARLSQRLGDLPARELTTESVRNVLSELRDDGFSLGTIRNTRARLRQVAEAAVELGLLRANPVLAVRNPKATARNESHGASSPPPRFAACSASSTAGTASMPRWRSSSRRGSAYPRCSDWPGATSTSTPVRRLCDGPPPTPAVESASGSMPPRPNAQRGSSTWHRWPSSCCEFAKPLRPSTGSPPARPGTPRSTKATPSIWCSPPRKAAPGSARTSARPCAPRVRRAGIDPAGVGTHTGRRSTVTNLYAAGATIDDVAAHVGHSSTETTRGYVQHLGDRPAEVARRAWALLEAED